MRSLVVAAFAAFALAGCCATDTMGAAPDECGKPIYKAPDCAGRAVEPVAQSYGAPIQLPAIKWPWECDEATRGQPVYAKPDCSK